MRMKSDQRREAILDAAAHVFKTIGYDRATMETICAQVGGSKTTLYSYYGSKEKLFAAAMMRAVFSQGEAIGHLLDKHDPDVAAVLKRFGVAFVSLITNPDALSVVRSAVMEGVHIKLGPALYDMGPRRGETELASYLAALPSTSGLRVPDPVTAGRHLKALLEAGFLEPCLYGVPVSQNIDAAVDAAVETFLRAYATPVPAAL